MAPVSEERFIELEIKLTRLEDLAQDLSQAVYRQQKQIDELQALGRLLLGRLDEASGGPDAYAHEKPPHYRAPLRLRQNGRPARQRTSPQGRTARKNA